MSEWDIFLPLAAACSDSSLLEVRSSFVEACGRAAFAIMARLQERALEVPSSAPMKNLPALLSTCIYVHQQLQQYVDTLKDPRNAARVYVSWMLRLLASFVLPLSSSSLLIMCYINKKTRNTIRATATDNKNRGSRGWSALGWIAQFFSAVSSFNI